jgi:hypothetical protein
MQGFCSTRKYPCAVWLDILLVVISCPVDLSEILLHLPEGKCSHQNDYFNAVPTLVVPINCYPHFEVVFYQQVFPNIS